MTKYALLYERVNGRDSRATEHKIPPDSTPADELNAFFQVLDANHVPHHEMSPGRYAFCFEHAEQVWSVRVVTVGELEDTQHDLDKAV